MPDRKKCWIEYSKGYFETRQKSKVYKGQAAMDINIQRHPLDKTKWSYSYGQAAINMEKFNTQAGARKAVMAYINRYGGMCKRR